MKYAWQFILENQDIESNYNVLCQLHKLTAGKLVLDQNLGKIRTTGTTWKPDFPIESKIRTGRNTNSTRKN